MQPRATRQDYEIALSDLGYPANRDGVLRHAQDHGGIDTEVLAVLGQLPDRTYDTPEDLTAEVRALYLARGVPADAVPL